MSFDADIVIIGYGPVGVSAASILGRDGVKTICIEREQNIYPRARAVTVNDWTMRCFQSLGLDADLAATMDVTRMLRWKTYAGEVVNEIDFPPGVMGHPRSYAIYQPAMEKVLRAGVEEHADLVDIRFGEESIGIAQDGDGVTVSTRNLQSGKESRIRARYVLACDGGSSGTRESLGIGMVGDTIETKWVIIDAMVKRWWPNRHIMTFWSDKKRPAVDIGLSMGTHRWELPLEEGESEDAFSTHDKLYDLLADMGVTREDVQIHQHAFYKHHIRYAERWRDGRVFLLGDAAHLMPPWAGSGMQSGIRDAFNLCWKLVEVLRGTLPDTVLDSYQPERAPDVERYTQISVMLGRIIKQEMSEEELAAVQAQAAKEELNPLHQPPVLHNGWLRGSTGADSVVGQIIPQPEVCTTTGIFTLLDKQLGNGFALLGDNCDPATMLNKEQKAGWDALGARYIAVRDTDQHSTQASDVIDVDATLLGFMRGYGAKVIAVRPDRFVAASDIDGLAIPD
tara:strand:- start:21105 stop:22631 length:1527 start_codon:yes stop_codon:yes gene_type:complete